jgi:hypothetical protein
VALATLATGGALAVAIMARTPARAADARVDERVALPVAGCLSDPQGKHVHGKHSVVLSLYPSATATEREAVHVERRQIAFGDCRFAESLNVPASRVTPSQKLYLGVTLEGASELTPRLDVARASGAGVTPKRTAENTARAN